MGSIRRQWRWGNRNVMLIVLRWLLVLRATSRPLHGGASNRRERTTAETFSSRHRRRRRNRRCWVAHAAARESSVFDAGERPIAYYHRTSAFELPLSPRKQYSCERSVFSNKFRHRCCEIEHICRWMAAVSETNQRRLQNAAVMPNHN